MPYQTASLPKRWNKRHFVWLMVILLFSSVTLAGIGIGARFKLRRAWREQRAEQMRVPHRSVNEDIQNALGFKAGSINDAGYPGIKGVFVESLMTDDGPAALAKIQAGDVLTYLNEQPVRNPGEVAQVLDSLKPDTEVVARVYREGGDLSPRIKIADRSHAPLQPKIEFKDQGYLGVKESVRRCCTPTGQKWGVEIQGVNENSPADLAGLQSGDVITEFNDHAVQTPGEFNRRIRATKPRTKVSVTFYRGSAKQTTEMILGYRWN
ncbi:MAG: PDZ domain-containing protein [Blastocatellia bacterium]